MDRYSGWTRGTAVAALMVLSTGACAQRVPLPPQQVVAPAPVVQQAQPAAPRQPVVQAPVVQAPVARAPAPRPPVAVDRLASIPVEQVARAPQRQIVAAPIPAPVPQERTAPPPVDAPPGAVAVAPLLPLTSPRVAAMPPPRLGGQYAVAEVASADYGSAQDSSPTPDTAPDIAAMARSDAPPAPPVARTPPPPRQSAPAPDESDPLLDSYSALASLFGVSADEEPDVAEVAEVAEVAAPPQAALPVEPPAPEANPYSGGFDDSGAYETAQIYQQPTYQQPTYQQPDYGYNPAPAPPPPVARFDPTAPVTIAILTPDTDSRPSIRTLAKGLARAAALSARTQGNRQLVLRGYDTGGTPEKARLAAQQAIADGAQLIVGPLFSSSAAAVAPVAQGSGVPVIAFTTDEGVLGSGIYSVGYLPDAEVERMLSYAAKRGIRKIGLLSPDTPYGGIVFRTVQATAPAYGVNVATVQPISTNFAEAASTGERFANFYKATPDTNGVLIATNGKPLQGIAAYLAYNDVLPSKVQYMGLGTWDDPETFREATLRGGWFPGIAPALKAEFEGRYSGAYGGKPPAIATLAYDGIAIAGALLQRAQSTGQAPFTRQNIESPTGFRGMSGLFRFLPDGRNQRLLSILKVGRREFEMLDPAPTAFNQRVTSAAGYSQ